MEFKHEKDYRRIAVVRCSGGAICSGRIFRKRKTIERAVAHGTISGGAEICIRRIIRTRNILFIFGSLPNKIRGKRVKRFDRNDERSGF